MCEVKRELALYTTTIHEQRRRACVGEDAGGVTAVRRLRSGDEVDGPVGSNSRGLVTAGLGPPSRRDRSRPGTPKKPHHLYHRHERPGTIYF
jgi:hypothetical protein